MGEWFSFRSISAWIFSHRTDTNSNGNGKSLAFYYKYSLVISSDCYSCLISIHSVYFQISVVWGLTLIYRQWTHSTDSEYAPLDQSFVENASPAPRAAQMSQMYRAVQCIPYLTSHEGQTLTGFGSADHLTGAIKKSRGHGGEGKAWAENMSEGY